MKVRIKWYRGDLVGYLTKGKEYSLPCFDDDDGGCILDDDGDEIYILLEECAYLNGGSWEIVE